MLNSGPAVSGRKETAMMSRIAVVFLALSLLPTLSMAQRRGSGRTRTRMSSPGGRLSGPAMSIGSRHRQSGHRYGHGHFRPGALVAPPTGYGNINHPGLGYAPNTPGIGVPLSTGIQPLPTINQPLIGPIRPGVTNFGRPPRHGSTIGLVTPAATGVTTTTADTMVGAASPSWACQS